MRKLTTEDFIARARKVHGDRYDYSLVKYDTSTAKVKIICSDHGVFEQRPHDHWRGRKCSKCGLIDIGNALRASKADFVRKARQVHGNKYDYSRVKYVTARKKVKIFCPGHGYFDQVPGSHLRGGGCPTCAGHEKLSKDEFISRSRETHGSKYDYTKVEYVNNLTKVKIICPEHGLFEQSPYSHMQGTGCAACSGNKKLNTQEFVQLAHAIHGQRYDYSLVEYVNNSTKVKIVCIEHGVFEQAPSNHLDKHGCPACVGLKKLSTQEFIKRARAIHEDKYSYALVQYQNIDSKVRISCPDHGIFEQTPYKQLYENACPQCGILARADGQRSTKDEFIEASKRVHEGKYDYSRVQYTDSRSKVEIICPEHGSFWQQAFEHKSGSGCRYCAGGGFDPSKPGTLYYVREESRFGTLYKIGITNRTLQERFQLADLDLMTVIKLTHYESGQDAYDYEQTVLTKYAYALYSGDPVLSSGNYELFNHDVLELDKEFRGLKC